MSAVSLLPDVLDVHVPHSDHVISVSCVQIAAVRAPAQRNAVSLASSLAGCIDGDFKSFDELLSLQIPDFHGRAGRGAQPVTVRRKYQSVDDVIRLQRVQSLALVEVPKHGRAVFAARCTKRSIRRNSHGVQVSSVADQIADKFAVVQGPNFHEVVPTT